MQVLHGSNTLSKILCRYLFIKAALLFQHWINLAFATELQNQIEIVIVFIMIVEPQNVVMVQFVHYFDFQLDLLNEIVFQDLLFINDFNCKYILGHLMPNFIDFSKSTNTNVWISKGFKIVFAAFSFLTSGDRRRQKQNSIFNVVDFIS